MSLRTACLFLVMALLAVASAPGAESSGKIVLCLGDSLTEGFGVAEEYAYPTRLRALLANNGHPKAKVINAGVSGSTTASAVMRLEWQFKSKPDVVILELGANDGLRGLQLRQTRDNLRKAIQLAKSHEVMVLLAGMKLPPNYGPEYANEFESMFPDLARELDVALIPFFLKGVAGQPELNLGDGLHPNRDGYAIVVETVLEYLLPLL